MSEEKDEIKDLFNSAFKDFEADVDDKVWMNIEKELHPESERRFVWWRWAAAAVIIGGISIFALLNLPADKEPLAEQKVAPGEIIKSQEDIVEPETLQTDQIAEGEARNEKIEEEPPGSQGIDAAKEKELAGRKEIEYSGSSKTSLAISSVPTDAGNTIVAHTPVELSNNIDESLVISTLIDDTVTDIAAIIDEDTTKADSAATLAMTEMSVPESNDIPIVLSDSALTALLIDTDMAIINEPILLPEQDESKWLLAANFLSAGGSGSIPSNQATTESMDMNSAPLIFSTTFTTFDTAGTPIMLITQKILEYGETRYLPPIITSITVNHRLSKRWSLESGLSYTVLLSNRETPLFNQEQKKQNVKLQYLGIPLLVNFNIVSGKKFTWYTSLGAMAEKGLNSKITTIHLSNGETIDKLIESNPLQGIDVSALFGMGLDYRINKLLSYYLQPGLSAYFVTDGSPYNPRVSRSVWPNIQTGLRIHF